MPPDSVLIRNADAKDIEAMLGLLRLLFEIEADFEFDEARQRRGLFMMTDGCLKHKVIKVAEAGSGIVGMASAQTLISTVEGGMCALVEDVVVRPEWRKQGIGRRLVQSLCEWAAMRGAVRLQVLADVQNRPALEFYQRTGWRKTQLICLRKRNDLS
jgi:GNAT superfamily N-acetyltransferase